MSGGFWRIVFVLAILVHGIGHVLFLAPCLGITRWGKSAQSRLLTRTLGDVPTRVIGSVLSLVVIVGFATAGFGLLGQRPWRRALAVASAGLSLLVLVLFASAGGTQPVLSAALLDVSILTALLLVHWPTAGLLGA